MKGAPAATGVTTGNLLTPPHPPPPTLLLEKKKRHTANKEPSELIQETKDGTKDVDTV